MKIQFNETGFWTDNKKIKIIFKKVSLFMVYFELGNFAFFAINKYWIMVFLHFIVLVMFGLIVNGYNKYEAEEWKKNRKKRKKALES